MLGEVLYLLLPIKIIGWKKNSVKDDVDLSQISILEVLEHTADFCAC